MPPSSHDAGCTQVWWPAEAIPPCICRPHLPGSWTVGVRIAPGTGNHLNGRHQLRQSTCQNCMDQGGLLLGRIGLWAASSLLTWAPTKKTQKQKTKNQKPTII